MNNFRIAQFGTVTPLDLSNAKFLAAFSDTAPKVDYFVDSSTLTDPAHDIYRSSGFEKCHSETPYTLILLTPPEKHERLAVDYNTRKLTIFKCVFLYAQQYSLPVFYCAEPNQELSADAPLTTEQLRQMIAVLEKKQKKKLKAKKNKLFFYFCKGIRYWRRNGTKAFFKKLKYRIQARKIGRLIIDKKELESQRLTKFPKDVKFSILVPLYNTPIRFLTEMIGSVKAQTYANWELCLADGSDDKHPEVEKSVLEMAAQDTRIIYKKLEKNLGISGNTNACIDMASGNYIVLFDHDDLLHPSALFEVMKAICERNADFIYTDEATFESPNLKKITTLHFKPDYAIDNLRANNYICHLSVFSKQVLEKAGKFRPEYDGSQDHDMILRLTANAEQIVHIPKILYYWRSHPQSVAMDINSKTYAIEAGKKAVKSSLETYGYHATVESSRAFPTIYRLKYELTETPLISILIPNKDHPDDLKRCLNSIWEKSTYQNYEIVIVDNGSTDADVLEYYKTLEQKSGVKICKLDIPFNYSKLNNFAAKYASGKYYVLLNNDVEIITPNWIEEMLMFAQREDVAAVGAMLYFPDDTIQHAGIILGLGANRVAGYLCYKTARNEVGYMGRLCYAQNLSVVTAACMMVKASAYHEVNGLDESFQVAYNDVDFCLRLRQKGYLIVWTPYAEAYHYESKTRGSDAAPARKEEFEKEAEAFRTRWKDELEKGDPYFNPNFSLDNSEFMPMPKK